MATSPNLLATPRVSSVRVTAANTNSQGSGTIGTDIFLVGTVGASGSFVDRVRFSPTATTPTTTTATVGRVFYSTVSSGTTTNINTFLLGEITLSATAADNASTSAPLFDLPININLPSGTSILVTNHAAPAANTTWVATMIGADF